MQSKFLYLLVVLFCLSAQAESENYNSEQHNFTADTLLDQLDHPWGMSFLPDGNLLVTQRTGKLLRANLSSGVTEEIKGLPEIHEHGQGGLLDILVHPEFGSNNLIYFSYVNNDGRRYGTEVARARLTENTLTDLETIFVALPKVTGTRHFGSRLAIDNDNFLFISLGDRGDRIQAQKLDSHIGSLIRLHDDGSVPETNPFVGNNNSLPEIYSYGHRNIQGMDIRISDRSLWTHEHGPQGGDEINRPEPGLNYGWPVITYGANYVTGTEIGEGTHKDGMQQPVYYWDPSIAPSGMAFYESDKFPLWADNLFVGSLKFSSLVRLVVENQQIIHEERLLTGKLGRIRDVEVGPDGLIYLLTDSTNGKLVRLSPGTGSG